MKVKTFAGTHRLAVDRQVNDWLAKSDGPPDQRRLEALEEQGLATRGRQSDDAPSGGDCHNGLVQRRMIKLQNQIRPLGFLNLTAFGSAR